MKVFSSSLRWVFPAILLAAAGAAGSQQIPPAEPPLPMPGAHQESPTIRVTTNEVLVPTLVQMPSGEIVYGLGPTDFQLLDNGILQQLHVDDDLDSEPVSVVVAVEKGRMAALEFDKVNRLAPLIDLFLGDGSSEAAFVSFAY